MIPYTCKLVSFVKSLNKPLKYYIQSGIVIYIYNLQSRPLWVTLYVVNFFSRISIQIFGATLQYTFQSEQL